MDEADEFCVGKGYDGAADKLTRQELDDLHTQWKGKSDAFETFVYLMILSSIHQPWFLATDLPSGDKTGFVYALKRMS